nr:MAG TPA: hypothetical protein [Caudoviricetes sp.]
MSLIHTILKTKPRGQVSKLHSIIVSIPYASTLKNKLHYSLHIQYIKCHKIKYYTMWAI